MTSYLETVFAGGGPQISYISPDGARCRPLPWLRSQSGSAVLEATSARPNDANTTRTVEMGSGTRRLLNAGEDPEHIEPLGVRLKGGHTMAVYWMPGETAYAVEPYRQKELCA